MNKQTLSIYTAGLFQGISLVAFPAASTILTAPDSFHFTSTQYGSLFIPQAVLSILTALLNPMLCRYFGSKWTLSAGLIANFISMTLLALSASISSYHSLAYWVLFTATSCLGIGFGAIVPTINRMAEQLYPSKSDSAVLNLNALLGIGTTLAPVFIALFTAIGFWWGLPLFLSDGYLALICFNLVLTFPEEKVVPAAPASAHKNVFALATLFISFAFLYGIIETLNGNWVSIYMSKHLGASVNVQALALTSFWGMVTFGRVFFAAISKFFNEQIAFQVAPFISAIACVIIASLISGQEYWAVIAFGLIGFGCSVLLPLLISFGGAQLKSLAASVPGMIISSYLLGYGVAAFGVGPLEEFGYLSLGSIYLIGAAISFILGLLAVYIIQRRKGVIGE